jgi:hypothetical protein
MAEVWKLTITDVMSESTDIDCTTRVYQVSQSIANNTSLIHVVTTVYCTNHASWFNNTTSRIRLYIAGSKIFDDSGSEYNYDFYHNSYTSKVILDRTFTVSHDTDGDFSKLFRCLYETDAGSQGTADKTGTLALTTIPRASVLSNISSFNIEDGVTISYTAYASFTEKLDIYLGATAIRTGYELASGSKVEFTDDEILKFYKYISDLTATVTFNLKTYSGSTQIGSTSTKTATGTIAGFLRKGVGGVMKRCVVYKNIGGNIKKCIPYIGVGGSVKRGIY